MTVLSLAALALAAVWTVLIGMVLLTAHYRRIRDRLQTKRHPATPDQLKALRCVLLRPCAGDEPSLFECLTSISRARRNFPVQVRFGVDSESDPALPVIRRAAAQLASEGIESRVEVVPPMGPNRKVSILAGLTRYAETDVDIVISADSNTDLADFDLNRLVTPLVAGSASAVWTPPRLASTHSGMGNRAAEAVLNASWHSFGLLGAIDPGGMVGKLFAVTRRALDDIGGFGAMVRYLGEDMEMSKRLREAGGKVARFDGSVRTVAGQATFESTVARHARWIMVIKAQRRPLLASFPLLFFNTPLVGLLALPGLYFNAAAALLVLGAALLLRLLVAVSAARMLGTRPPLHRIVTYSVLADVVLMRAFIRALGMRSVKWRSRELFFGPDGRLQEGTVRSDSG